MASHGIWDDRTPPTTTLSQSRRRLFLPCSLTVDVFSGLVHCFVHIPFACPTQLLFNSTRGSGNIYCLASTLNKCSLLRPFQQSHLSRRMLAQCTHSRHTKCQGYYFIFIADCWQPSNTQILLNYVFLPQTKLIKIGHAGKDYKQIKLFT